MQNTEQPRLRRVWVIDECSPDCIKIAGHIGKHLPPLPVKVEQRVYSRG